MSNGTETYIDDQCSMARSRTVPYRTVRWVPSEWAATGLFLKEKKRRFLRLESNRIQRFKTESCYSRASILSI